MALAQTRHITHVWRNGGRTKDLVPKGHIEARASL